MSTNKILAGSGFHHVAIRTNDWDKSRAFYCDALGFVERIQWGEAPGRACMLDLGDGNYLEIFERDSGAPVEGESNLLHWSLRVENCATAVEIARAAGAEVTLEPTIPGVIVQQGVRARIAFVKGPDGEILEFFETADL